MNNAEAWLKPRSLASFSLWMLCLGGGLLLCGCPPASRKPDAGQGPVKRVVKNKIASFGWDPTWISRTWLDKVALDHKILSPFLSEEADESLRDDVKALLTNQLVSTLKTFKKVEGLKPKHRVIRARMHLQMAAFYSQLWQMAATHQVNYYEKRWSLRKKLQSGKLLPYYYGRLLCMQGKRKEAVSLLKLAIAQVPKGHILRVKAWLQVCGAKRNELPSVTKSLAALKFTEDDDGWSEWILLHSMFHLKTSAVYKTPSLRARLFEAAWKGKPMALKYVKRIVGRPVDAESISEGTINVSLAYYDPALPRAMMLLHATQLRRLLASDKAPEAHMLRAKAMLFSGEKKKAKEALERLLARPPKSMNWSYFLFSPWMTLEQFLLEAKLMKFALSNPTEQKIEASKLEKAATLYPARTLVGLSFLRLGIKPAETYDWVEKGVDLIHKLKQDLSKNYRVRDKLPGSQIIRNIGLYRLAWRPFYLAASKGALIAKKPHWAANWLGILHDKDKLFTIGAGNAAGQILLTIRALLQKRDNRSAAQFLLRNRRDFPSLDQIREPVNLLQIIIHKDGPGIVKDG